MLDGYKEVTLLGQNVDSYYGLEAVKDFNKLSQEEQEKSTNFAELLAMVAEVIDLRVRFLLHTLKTCKTMFFIIAK